MPRNVRTYEHFCLVARALERFGDRWSLLVIRDLLSGRKRFTDLMERLGGITPKTLTQRLHELEEAGIVEADREPGRREVWYRLTATGSELAPIIDALGLWGLRHAWRRPRPGEPLHGEHLIRAIVQAIDFAADDRDAAHWRFNLDGRDYFVESDGGHWSYTTEAPDVRPEVTVTGTASGLARFVLAGIDTEVTVEGESAAVKRFRNLAGTIATVVEEQQG